MKVGRIPVSVRLLHEVFHFPLTTKIIYIEWESDAVFTIHIEDENLPLDIQEGTETPFYNPTWSRQDDEIVFDGWGEPR